MSDSIPPVERYWPSRGKFRRLAKVIAAAIALVGIVGSGVYLTSRNNGRPTEVRTERKPPALPLEKANPDLLNDTTLVGPFGGQTFGHPAKANADPDAMAFWLESVARYVEDAWASYLKANSISLTRPILFALAAGNWSIEKICKDAAGKSRTARGEDPRVTFCFDNGWPVIVLPASTMRKAWSAAALNVKKLAKPHLVAAAVVGYEYAHLVQLTLQDVRDSLRVSLAITRQFGACLAGKLLWAVDSKASPDDLTAAIAGLSLLSDTGGTTDEFQPLREGFGSGVPRDCLKFWPGSMS